MKINDIFVSPTSDRIISASADETCKVIQRFFFNLKIMNTVFRVPDLSYSFSFSSFGISIVKPQATLIILFFKQRLTDAF